MSSRRGFLGWVLAGSWSSMLLVLLFEVESGSVANRSHLFILGAGEMEAPESSPSHQISPEEIQSLQQIVQLVNKGTITKPEALSRLTIKISSICIERSIKFTPDLIRPYVEQLDAAEREKNAATERGEQVGTR
ncbi:hypothetical protein BT96DRAFT_989187 [Gymnopus androsaceus JB14]|uniref:Uncharacterized protein n=1 Tax=Gymnopus androsaceus JB14 TaxID=1447944 RepID=A0A6A4I6D5_9AGAR|nr:hypothetical protein BT96DRAFT_989187 [Gymnopus androsaceus JB14]